MRLSDGSRVPVPHPEYVWVPPESQRTIAVGMPEDGVLIIDLLLVSVVEIGNGRSKRRRPRKN